jgi:hypothetical protein
MPFPRVRIDSSPLAPSACAIALAVVAAGAACSPGTGITAGLGLGLDASSGGEDAMGPGSADASDATTDAGPSDAPSPGDATQCVAPVGDAACVGSPPTGPMVGDTCASGEPPQMQGGTIEDGVYVLQSAIWYGPCQPATTSTTAWTFCGGQVSVAQTDFADGGSSTLWVAFDATTAGTTITLTPICSSVGNVGAMMRNYTATPGHLAFSTSYARSNGNAFLVSQYLKQ